MALQSQSTRSGMSRQYMVSRRRGSKGPWLALGAVALIVGAAYLFFIYEPANVAGTGGEDPASGDVAGGPGSSGPGTLAGVGGAGRDRAPSVTLGAGNSNRNTTAGNTNRDRDPRPTPPIHVPSQASELIGEAQEQYDNGMRLIDAGDLVTGRALLSELLFREGGGLPRNEARAIRERLTHINQQMVFSHDVIEGDPIAGHYRVRSGENLGSIARPFQTPHQFIMRINGITDASRLRADQSIKIIHGPIHARVTKHDYRMDLYVDAPDGLPIYLCSYQVGLGQLDSTPVGNWLVRRGGKVTNPSWTDPVTNIRYERDDPRVPVGEFWIGLIGADEGEAQGKGYGIHGTIDPESIGQQESRGCIRMRDGDIDQVFNMLTEGQSRVEILP